jgi:hypothetical protein
MASAPVAALMIHPYRAEAVVAFASSPSLRRRVDLRIGAAACSEGNTDHG